MDLGKLSDLSQRRVCLECGAQFETIAATKDRDEVSALAQFSDHTTVHNPTGAQWTEAHNRIQALKKKSGLVQPT